MLPVCVAESQFLLSEPPSHQSVLLLLSRVPGHTFSTLRTASRSSQSVTILLFCQCIIIPFLCALAWKWKRSVDDHIPTVVAVVSRWHTEVS